MQGSESGTTDTSSGASVRPRRSSRQSVLDAATVVLAANPGASMSVIAQSAGIGRATLYRHFASREQLIRELSREAIRACDDAVVPVFADWVDARTALEGMLEALIPLGDRYHFLAVEGAGGGDSEVASEVQRQAEEMLAFVEQAQAEGLFAAALPGRWIAAVIDALVWTAWSEVASGSIAPHEAATLALQTLLEGVSQPAT